MDLEKVKNLPLLRFMLIRSAVCESYRVKKVFLDSSKKGTVHSFKTSKCHRNAPPGLSSALMTGLTYCDAILVGVLTVVVNHLKLPLIKTIRFLACAVGVMI